MTFDSIVVDDSSSVLTPPRVTSAVRYPSVWLGMKCQLCNRSQTLRGSRGAYWRKGRLLHGSAFTSSPARQVFAPSSAITPQCATKGRTNFSRAIPITPSKTSNARHRFFLGGNDYVASIAVQQEPMAAFQANGQPLDWHIFHRAGPRRLLRSDIGRTSMGPDGEFPGQRIVKQLTKHQDQEIV